MMITRATEYACLAMLYLAKQRPGAVCFTAEIAEAEHIPPAFLVKVMPRLVKAGLVSSRRGSNGGIELAKPASAITMRMLVEVIEGEIAANVCTSSQPFSCFRSGCALRGAFQQAQSRFLESLEGVTLADLVGQDAYQHDEPVTAH